MSLPMPQLIADDDWGDLFERMGAPAAKVIKKVIDPGPVTLAADPFVHPCEVCGDFAYWGYGVKLRDNKLGEWFCNKHRPDKRSAGHV